MAGENIHFIQPVEERFKPLLNATVSFFAFKQGRHFNASGIHIGNGWFFTSKHVVEDLEDIGNLAAQNSRGKWLTPSHYTVSDEYDLAIVEIPHLPSNFPFVHLADEQNPKLGTPMAVVSFQKFPHIVMSTGMYKGVLRQQSEYLRNLSSYHKDGKSLHKSSIMLKMEPSNGLSGINDGASGSGIVDLNNRLYGVLSSTADLEVPDEGIKQFLFAAPVQAFQPLIEKHVFG